MINATMVKMLLDMALPYLKERVAATETKIDDLVYLILEDLAANPKVIQAFVDLISGRSPDTAAFSESDKQLLERVSDHLIPIKDMVTGCDNSVCAAVAPAE